MKRITITGNLGKDAECREGQGGHKFVSFSVAYAERDTDAKDEQGNPIKEAQWADCEIYVKPENSAEGIVNLLKKGRFIYVEAYDKVEAWLDKENKPGAAFRSRWVEPVQFRYRRYSPDERTRD